MNHKQKIRYTILGAFIMLIGMWIGNSTSPPLIAQSNGEITCEQLTFVSETGLPLFTLQAEQTKDKDSSLYIRNRAGKKTMELRTNSFANSVFVYDRDEKAVVLLHGLPYVGGIVYTKFSEGEFSTSMSSGEHGGAVTVYDKEGETAVKLSTREHSGHVTVHGKDGKGRIIMDFDELGGHVTVLKKDSGSEKAVQIRGFESGGHVGVYGKDGLHASLGSGAVLLFGTGGTAAMSTNGDYANIVVKDKEGEKAAEMEVTEHGGRIDVFNKQGKNRAAMSVNEYGNGAVSTWDKNGYRQ